MAIDTEPPKRFRVAAPQVRLDSLRDSIARFDSQPNPGESTMNLSRRRSLAQFGLALGAMFSASQQAVACHLFRRKVPPLLSAAGAACEPAVLLRKSRCQHTASLGLQMVRSQILIARRARTFPKSHRSIIRIRRRISITKTLPSSSLSSPFLRGAFQGDWSVTISDDAGRRQLECSRRRRVTDGRYSQILLHANRDRERQFRRVDSHDSQS